MCFVSGPKVHRIGLIKPPLLIPPPPAPPPPEFKAPPEELGKKDKERDVKRSGTKQFRIDLTIPQTGSKGSGVNIPQ